MGDDSEWLKLPTEEKVQHKVWKARLTGYEEVTKLFNSITEEKSPEFSKYAGLLKKFVADNNAVAQEKALEAVLAFLENAALGPKTAGEVVSAVVAKCMNAGKQKTREKGMEIIMIYIELDKPDIVQDGLMAGLENKQPKIVVGCLTALREALRDFGSKVIQLKPIVKTLPKLLEDRDKNVREETKLLCIEVYRWIGAAFKPQMTHFKPVQVAELEAEFEKLPSEKPQQTRFMRSQQDLKNKMEEKAAAAAAGGGEEAEGDVEEEEIDPYEMMEAVDVISKLSKDFYEKIEAKKWQERREALEELLKLTETPKLAQGDYSSIVRALLKVIAKDSNVMLVGIGGKCLASLAKGLQKKFAPYAVQCVSTVLEKFKEKKKNVVDILKEAIDAAFFSTNLEAIMEDVLAALENKNPNIRAEATSFVARCFAKSTTATLPKKLLKTYCVPLLKTVNDTFPEVREASFEALGIAMKVVTEKHMMPFLADIEPIKLQKIQECCTKAVLLNAKGEPRSSGGAAPPKANQPKPVQRPATAPEKTTSKAASGGRPQTAGGSKKKGGAKAAAGGKTKGGKKGQTAANEEPTELTLSDEQVEEKAAAILPAELIAQLGNSNWKDRLAGMEKFTEMVKGMTKDEIPCQVFVKIINKKPGLKDTHFQVLKLRVDLVAYLAQNSVFTKTSAGCCLTELVDKLGDVKNGSGVKEALSCMAEAISLEYIVREAIKLAFDQKNPKNQSEALNWLAQAIKEFGLKLNMKPLVEYLKKAFAHTNPAVRTAAITLLGVVYMYMGPPVRMLFEDEKAALLQQIDAEIEKVKGEKPPTSTRGVKPATEEEEEEEEEGGAGGTEEVKVEDLMPRNDIGDKFTPELITELGDKNWKVRNEALQKVAAILNEAKFITANLGPLPEAIKARLGDSNKILVNLTVGICQTLATNMGPHSKHHIKTIGPALVNCLSDSKPQLRAATITALNSWVEHCTLTPLVEIEALSDALKLENPNLRQELLGWLTEKLPSHKQLPAAELKLCIPHLLSCVEDRNADVRKKAQDALVPFMIHIGYDSVFKAASKLKPASKEQILPILEKAKANLPAKPVKAKKAAPVAAPKSAPRDDSDTEPEPPPKEEPPAEAKSAKTVKGRGKAPPPSKKKKEEEDMGPLMTTTISKEQRFKEEKALKVLKWNFTEPRPEYVEQLKLQMEKNFSKSFMDQLYHIDFKLHIKAIESLIKCIDSLKDETVINLDLILKWLSLRFFDTNPSMLNKALEYLRQLFEMLVDVDYHLTDIEATSFIPYLVNKVGDSKDNVRRDVRNIFKLIYKVYPASKIFSYLLDGLKSKNAKQRTECLAELGYLIETYGITICQPSPAQALKIIAGQISDRDNGVRNAALTTLVSAFMILGENIFKYLGSLNDKDQSLLDERIKRSAKTKGPAPGKAEERPRTAPQQPQRSASQANISRPHTAMPKSASSNSMRREFMLEYEDEVGGGVEIPKLIQHDLEEIFQPVQLPKIKARPPSPSMKLLNSSDASATISFVISQITNADIATVIQALAQIDELLKDEDKAEVLVSQVDQLLIAMSMQFKMVYSTHMSSDVSSTDEVLRLYRCLMGTLLALFQNTSLAPLVSKDILKDLVHSLVTVLLDTRLQDLEEGPQVIRSVNVMVVKIVEKSDNTNILSALIRLLQDCVGNETCSPKFLELIMKCLWKMVRMLPDIINNVNLDRVLFDIHLFLRAFPANTWKNRPSDMPLRTMKTICHSLAKLKGSKIMGHTAMIDPSEHSEVKLYLQKALKNDNENSKNEEINGNDGHQTPKSASKSKRLSKSTHDMLAEIFKKIGSKENTREGLNDLYDFKSKYPEADLEPFLKKSSQFFQNYIERGLKNIELERDGKKAPSIGGPVPDFPTIGKDITVPEGEGDVNVDYYRERLRILRARCGLENETEKEEEPQPPSPKPEIVLTAEIDEAEASIKSSVLESQENVPAPAVDVSELKMRLERIKKLAKS